MALMIAFQEVEWRWSSDTLKVHSESIKLDLAKTDCHELMVAKTFDHLGMDSQ